MIDDVQDRVTFDAETKTYHLDYDWTSSLSTSVAVSTVVAIARDIELTAIESIDTTIDGDALDRLFHPKWVDEDRDDGGHVTFQLNECRVTVERSGQIVVAPPD